MHQTVLLLALILTYSVPVISQNVTITAPSGVFYSPNYPSDYDNNIKMTYNITVPEGHYIYITVMDFVTEAYFDVLTIYDGGNSTPTYILSGDCTGQNYALSSNTAIFEFTTDLTGTAKGFAIQFDAIEMNASYILSDTCPPPLYNSDKGFVTRLSGDPYNLTSIVTTGNVMCINFVTDLVNTASGFSAFYQSIQ
ncbi:hypothetical protein WR25_22685 [Diploscapter pachys]|uniref:CUB domain-containing protein n=1 Tax=Diploscapter pachys TaxID=2018661 RepID=A0A2A2M0P9_9BILA|nr:hypothetical protein WR25_22685 [Diploscapter pachys]